MNEKQNDPTIEKGFELDPDLPGTSKERQTYRKFSKRQRLYRYNRIVKGMNQYNAARAAGYSHSYANKNGARIERRGRVGIKDLFEQAGLTDKFIIEYVQKGLEATKLNGPDCVEHADWMARHKFLGTALELEEKAAKAGINLNIDNSKHVTYVLSDRIKQARERVKSARASATQTSNASR